MTSAVIFLFTIREAIRRGTLVFYFLIGTVITIVLAFAIKLSPEDGQTVLLFGNPVSFGGMPEIDPLEILLVQLVRGAGGSLFLIGIFAVAGLIPSMLEKGTAELYLSKPISRPSLLISRAFGATAGVGVNILYFALGIFMVFGLKIGYWHWPVFAAASMIFVAFALFFSLVALVGMITKSQGFSIIFAFVFSFLSDLLESRERLLYLLTENVLYRRFLDFLYYATPQLNAMMENSYRLVGQSPMSRMFSAQAAVSFDIMPFVYSLLSAAALYGLSAWYFSKQDY